MPREAWGLWVCSDISLPSFIVSCQPRAGVEIAQDCIVLGQVLTRGEQQNTRRKGKVWWGCVHLCNPGMVHDIQEGWG